MVHQLLSVSGNTKEPPDGSSSGGFVGHCLLFFYFYRAMLGFKCYYALFYEIFDFLIRRAALIFCNVSKFLE